MTCIPNQKVIPIQERIKKCHKGFNTYNIICIRCDCYNYCKKDYIKKLKILKENIIKVKGKCPKGKRIKFSDVKGD